MPSISRMAFLAPVLLLLTILSCFGGGSPETTPGSFPIATLTPEAFPSATAAPVTSTTAPPAPTFPPTPQVPTGLFALDVDTGQQAPNRFLARMAARDFDSIMRNADFIPIACTTQRTGIPPTPICNDTEADGTPVAAMLHASCEPNYIRPVDRDLIGEGLGVFFQLGEPYLDSVWRTDFLDRSYAVVLVTRPGVQALAFIIYLDSEGNYAGRVTCADYRIPQGDKVKLYPK